MPLRSAVVGERLEPITVSVSPRMALAFAAGIGMVDPATLDDAAPGFAASPLYCASLEWRLVAAARNALLGVTAAEARQAVHAGQDSRFSGALRPGREVRVEGRILAVRASRAGAVSVTRLAVSDAASGQPVSETISTAVYRGVAVDGDDRALSGVEPPADPREAIGETIETTLDLDRGFAHRYSECAEIWNPIHTERAVALAAGLPDIIVHGSALWALAGRTLIERFAPGRPDRIRRLSGRFSAMVPAGTPITVRHAPAGPGAAVFSVLNAAGQTAVSHGVAQFVL